MSGINWSGDDTARQMLKNEQKKEARSHDE